MGAAVAALALVLAASLASPSDLGAQDWAVDRAERMEAEARSLADQREEWGYAAWLYRGAAELRAADDVEAVVDLQMAAKLAYYTGDPKQAYRDLVNAGERAMKGGDILTAGSTMLDAAWVAQKLERGRDAVRLAERARSLVDHPVLSDRVRATVLDRIVDGSAVIVAEGEAPEILVLAPADWAPLF